jgi:radical SAM protein with 4Fe4S-binding SPASM domain
LSELGVFFVNIAGGEPTSHPEFPEIIDKLISLNMHFILTTNGMGEKRCAEAIAKAKDLLVGLKVSLDGPTPESHGLLRVDSRFSPNLLAFDQTMATIAYLRTQGVPFTIASCLHSGNIRLMAEFVDLILQVRPTSWFVATISPSGRARDHFERIFASDGEYDTEFWNRIKTVCEAAGIYVRYIDMSFAKNLEAKPSAFTCPAATSFCEINSDGIVAPCPLSRVEIPQEYLKFENVRQKPIKEIWNGPAFTTFRAWRGLGCDGCVAFKACGRCVAQSFQWFKEPGTPAPYCVDKGEILQIEGLQELRARLDLERRRMSSSGLLKVIQ